MKRWTTWALWSIGILLFQSFVLSQVQLYGYLNPYLYVAVVLLAPATWSRMHLLWIGAAVGAWMDFQMHSGGMHLMASSLLAYFRPAILSSVLPQGRRRKPWFHTPRHGRWQMACLYGSSRFGPPRLPLCR